MKKKEQDKKYTIRISQEIHDLLLELKEEYGTLENGLSKIFKQWKETRRE